MKRAASDSSVPSSDTSTCSEAAALSLSRPHRAIRGPGACAASPEPSSVDMIGTSSSVTIVVQSPFVCMSLLLAPLDRAMHHVELLAGQPQRLDELGMCRPRLGLLERLRRP